MTVRYQLHVDCDGAGCTEWRATPVLPGAPTGTDELQARAFVAVAGWTRKHVNERDGDYCPDCSTFLDTTPALPAPPAHLAELDALTAPIDDLTVHAGFLAEATVERDASDLGLG